MSATFLRTPRPARKISPYLGRLVAAALTAAGGTGIALGFAAHSSEPLGRTVVVVFALGAPAVAIARLLPSVNAAVALVIASAGAAVINALVAQVMLSANAWSPPAGVIAVGVIAALLWLVPTGGPSRPDADRTHLRHDEGDANDSQ
jgi:hypothetical protein